VNALTLTQPWASLVALRAKHIETRSWTTAYRGLLAIHAGVGLGPVGGVTGLGALCAEEPFWSALVSYRTTPLPRGAILAIATLCDVRPIAPDIESYGVHMPDGDRRWDLTAQERAFGDYSPGRYAWLLSDIRPLITPIPAKGALGLWRLPPDVTARLEAP
jgi:hypothetical protein